MGVWGGCVGVGVDLERVCRCGVSLGKVYLCGGRFGEGGCSGL